MASIWNPSGSLGAQLQNWRQAQLGPKFSGQPRARLGPTRANFADPMRRVENLHFYCYFHRFFALMGVCASLCHIGLVLAPTSAPDAPTQDQVAHAKPNLPPNVRKLRHLRHQLGSSWALKLGPKDGQV